MGDRETPKMKPRPIVRLAIILITHSNLFSFLLCTSGIVVLLLLPILSKNTYVSENALMPGSANTMLSSYDVAEATRFIEAIIGSNSKSTSARIDFLRLIAKYMADVGAEVNYQSFYPQPNQFDPLQFFTGPNSGINQESPCSSCGINTIGIIRAPQGDGKECMVLVTPYNSSKIDSGEAVSLGIAYSVFSLLSRVTWLAKDVIWVAADSQYGEYTSVSAWLRDYHTPVFSGVGRTINSQICDENDTLHELIGNQIIQRKNYYDFRRAGTMASAFVIKIVNRGRQAGDTLKTYAEASNGQMPNLDLINIVNFLAHRQGLHVEVEKLWSLLDSKWVKIVGKTFELIGKVAKSLNPRWKFGISVADYIEGSATMASSLYFQALGVPTGSHGAFRNYQVDAITLEISPRVPFRAQFKQNDFLLRGGRLTEGVIRSVNNLLEKFHQSFFLYLLTSPSMFVSVGVYMIAFALLVAPLPVVAASLYIDANKSDSESVGADLNTSIKSWKWLSAAKQVFTVHLWGVVVSLFLHFISQVSNMTPAMSIFTWVLLSVLSLVVTYLLLGSIPRSTEWIILKSGLVSSAFIGLCLMSVINFATSELGALILVPMCLFAHPFKIDVKARNCRAFLRAAFNVIFVFIGFPPFAFFILKGLFEGFEGLRFCDFWTWFELLWAWKSATYLYIALVHMPCWALCTRVIFH